MIDHVAFGSRGFEAMKQHLAGKGIPHRVNQVPNSTRWQIFLRDPNNVEIELNFETKNETRRLSELDGVRDNSEDIMAKYLLVSFKTCPWVQRAAIVLREKGVDVRVPPYRAGQPARLVPRHLAAQEGAGAARRRQGVAVRVERDQRISRRDHRAAAASGRIRCSAPSTAPGPTILPTFSEHGDRRQAYAEDEADVQGGHRRKSRVAFERLEGALKTQSRSGPFFNGAKYSLVDAAYAPFLQRYYFLDRIKPLGFIEKFPRVKAWAEALMKRPSTHSFPEAEFEGLYRLNVKRRKKYLSQFIADQAVAAE